jgi:hypothetical protein
VAAAGRSGDPLAGSADTAGVAADTARALAAGEPPPPWPSPDAGTAEAPTDESDAEPGQPWTATYRVLLDLCGLGAPPASPVMQETAHLVACSGATSSGRYAPARWSTRSGHCSPTPPLALRPAQGHGVLRPAWRHSGSAAGRSDRTRPRKAPTRRALAAREHARGLHSDHCGDSIECPAPTAFAGSARTLRVPTHRRESSFSHATPSPSRR